MADGIEFLPPDRSTSDRAKGSRVAFDKTQPAYEAFRSQYSERTQSVVVWVGSGISVPAGLPTWLQLRDILCSILEKKLATIQPPDEKNLRLLRHARDHGDLWSAFQILKKSLGPSTFVSSVRNALSVSDSIPVPSVYELLWKLRIGGILNLNLDRLATKASAIVQPSKQVTEFVGCAAGKYAHVLQSPSVSFIANVHGVLAEESSWVFTRSDLNDLLNNHGYRHFINVCLTARTVLFIGLTADDVAVGGHLSNLKKTGVSFGSHYWLTSRTDKKTDSAAERLGMQVIRYNATDGDHGAVAEMLADLAAFLPEDVTPPPVVPSAVTADRKLPEPDELIQQKPDEIRDVLNRHAAHLLSRSDAEGYAAYEAFRAKYDRAIYQAWYTSTEPPQNDLLGYKLCSRIGGGAFGDVFDALSPEDESVAVKVLHQEVRKSAGMLESFRRGVRSMRILSERKVEGMVPYRAAAEIPAFAVMDLVNGPNLKKAVESNLLKGWEDFMKVAVELAHVIRHAHALPERVLHRDLRPSNIMLDGLYGGSSDWHVVVLDFDLSWHRDAFEKSVVQTTTATGYLAPEQLQFIDGVSTRSSAVDSYGFGMTMYFLCTGRDPMVAQHQSVDWQQRLDAIRTLECTSWRSLPIRVARLVQNSTWHTQADRWDMSQIEGELERLSKALENGRRVESAELLAEELFSRTRYARAYSWNSDKLQACIDLPTGVRVQLQGLESDRKLRADLTWFKGRGRKVEKYLGSALDQTKSVLSKAGWVITSDNPGSQEVYLGAEISVDGARSKLVDVARSLDDVITTLGK